MAGSSFAMAAAGSARRCICMQRPVSWNPPFQSWRSTYIIARAVAGADATTKGETGAELDAAISMAIESAQRRTPRRKRPSRDSGPAYHVAQHCLTWAETLCGSDGRIAIRAIPVL